MDKTYSCHACKERKPGSEFGDDKTRNSGKASACRACVREKVRLWKLQNPDKDKRNDKKAIRSWQVRNREKYIAHHKVWRAIKLGVLLRPKVCSSCERERRIHGHHPDYSKPLEVVWLCHICHRNIHKELADATR